MNYWPNLDDDVIIAILLYCEPCLDMMRVSATCHFSRNIILSEKSFSLSYRRSISFCVYGDICSCGRRPSDLTSVLRLLKSKRFTSVDMCTSISIFGLCLEAMSFNGSISKLYVSIPHIDRTNYNGLLEFQVPHTISSAQFINMKELTIHSPDIEEVSLASCHRLLSVLGKSLTSLSFIHSCPTNLASILEETCPNLLSLRMDAYSDDASTPAYRSEILEELIFIHPCVYRRRLGDIFYLPNLKKFRTHGRLDDIDRFVKGLMKSNCILLTHFDLAGASPCASNEVICAIAVKYSLLESLILCSEEPAHLITVETM
eukprot:gene12464-26214_t